MALANVREKIQELLDVGDQNSDCEISKAEFMCLLQNKKALAILQDVGVDVIGVVDNIDHIFAADPVPFMEEDDEEKPQEITTATKEKTLSFPEFMKVILDLRGSNTATVRDIVDLRRFIIDSFQDLEARIGAALLRNHAPSSCSSLRLSLTRLPTRSFSAPQLQGEQRVVSQFHRVLDGAKSDLLAAHDQEIAAMRAETCRLQDLLSRCNGTPAPLQLSCSLDVHSPRNNSSYNEQNDSSIDTNGKPGRSGERAVSSQQAVEPGSGQCSHGQDMQHTDVLELSSCGKGCSMFLPSPGTSIASVCGVSAAWVPPEVPEDIDTNGGDLRSIPPNIAARVARAPTGWPGKKSTVSPGPAASHSL